MQRLYKHYGSLDLDEIMQKAKKGGTLMESVNYIHNIPFISIFLDNVWRNYYSFIIKGKISTKINFIIVCIVGILSAVLLVSVWKNEQSFTFMMGHFPAPLGK